MKIAVVSDVTYRASLPDDPNALGFYGSEQYHAVLAKALVDRGHEVSFYAPSGSTEIGTFHPLQLNFGKSELNDEIDNRSLDGSKHTDLLSFDYVIDMTPNCRDIEYIKNYHGYDNYCCYRNGYAANNVPRLRPEYRHFVVPSQQNAELFKQAGFPVMAVIKYGIPDFYSPGEDEELFRPFTKNGLMAKNYYIFPHRPTPEKGTEIVIKLAKDFPQETFVFAGHTPITEHVMARTNLQRYAASQSLENVKFVDIPLNPKHHFYKRELYRRAKACLAPFLYPQYKEGFGLSNAEAVACGTPLIITDSPSTRELWIENVDALICDGYQSFKLYIEHFSSYPLAPTNKFSVEEYAKNYEALIKPQTLVTES